jgi:hypothetical protein
MDFQYFFEYVPNLAEANFQLWKLILNGTFWKNRKFENSAAVKVLGNGCSNDAFIQNE